MQKTERILRDAGLPANAVPPRLLLPIIENSSVEDNETLQDMWAGLLATASQQTDTVSPSFIETLKQLTPDDARYLVRVRAENPMNIEEQWLSPGIELPPLVSLDASVRVSLETFERLGLIRRDYEMRENAQLNISAVRSHFVFTKHAVSFLEACHGPRPSDG